VARTLLDAGWTDVRALVGGFDAWRAAGYPLQPKSNGASRPARPKASMTEVRENVQKAEGDDA
jgi:3-mercaptopyruvate sulfurtransferase SseA